MLSIAESITRGLEAQEEGIVQVFNASEVTSAIESELNAEAAAAGYGDDFLENATISEMRSQQAWETNACLEQFGSMLVQQTTESDCGGQLKAGVTAKLRIMADKDELKTTMCPKVIDVFTGITERFAELVDAATEGKTSGHHNFEVANELRTELSMSKANEGAKEAMVAAAFVEC
eukprot:8631010-Pyramimonas_sp.AAC.1